MSVGSFADTAYAIRFLRLLTMPFTKTAAFKTGVIDKNILYGSWAGDFGNFQFMPSTIKSYAIDYNKNKTIFLYVLAHEENQ